MRAPNEPDVYDDMNEPMRSEMGTLYRVAIPGEYKHDYWANVFVEGDSEGLCNLHGWKWGEFRQPRPAIYHSENYHLLDVEKEVWNWLVEWELVESKRIGPEDSEFFATDKLLAS